MKRTGFLFLMFAAVSAISCLKEEMPQTEDQGQYFTFEASREALVCTKTVLVDNNNVEWVKGDQLRVFNGVGNDVGAVGTDGQIFFDEKWVDGWQFQGQNAGKSCLFKASSENFDATQNKYLLLYPYNSTYYGNVELSRLRFWLPENQKAVEGSFDPAYGYAVAKATSLETTPESQIVFKNVMALLKFTIPAELAGEITQIAVWGKNSDHVAGEIICDYSGDEPVTAPYRKYYTDKDKGKTATGINDANGMAPGYYYLVICPGEYSKGLVVSVTTKSGRNYRREKTTGFTLNSGVIYDMGKIEAETYNVKGKGITELPYAFSFDEMASNTCTYLRQSVGTYNTSGKYRDLFLYDDAVGATFQGRQIGTSAQVQGSAFWSNDRGAYNMPTKSMVSKEFAGDDYPEGAYYKLTIPVSMTLPKSFGLTFGLRLVNGSMHNWKVQYSNDDKTWYDGAAFVSKNAAYSRYSVTLTPTITFSDMLYLKIVPTGTALVGNTGSPFGADTRFWGGIVITDMSEQQTTPAPAGAVFFEAFDKMVGGVDYLLGGQPNGTAKLGGLADAWSKAIGSGSWTAPSATPTAWNNLTCSVVAVRPGYAQIGHTKTQQGMDWGSVDNVIGSIKTPKLAAGNLTVSFKAMMFRCPLIGRERVQYLIDKVTADKIIVNVIGGGTFEDETTSKTISGVSYSAFNTYTLAVKNATADTQVEFTSPASVPSTRWFIDDICVMKDGADTDVARTIQVANPNLKIALPKKSASNGKLVIMVPGGGYSGMNLVGDREGEGWASYYNERGFACATLRYTLPNGNCLLPVNDLKNAIKYIRDYAEELGVSEIGVHGFSAGGHLASTGATHFTGELRPDFQILFYPVITMRNATHDGSRSKFLGTNPSQYMLDLYSNELQVTEDTPKAFIMYYVPDTVVPQATNGAAYVEALKAKNVPVKTLIYDTCYPDSDTQNGHGWWERDTRIDGKHVKEHLSDWLETL